MSERKDEPCVSCGNHDETDIINPVTGKCDMCERREAAIEASRFGPAFYIFRGRMQVGGGQTLTAALDSLPTTVLTPSERAERATLNHLRGLLRHARLAVATLAVVHGDPGLAMLLGAIDKAVPPQAEGEVA